MSRDSYQRYDSPPYLPPSNVAPILEYYDVRKKHLIDNALQPAAVDERGIVDIPMTIRTALDLVDPSYEWPREEPQPDIHHFVWERSMYHPSKWHGNRLPRDFREIPFHKGYLPRQLHDFIHATIAPPPVPEYDVMCERVEAYRVAKQLFEAARRAIIFEKRPERFRGVERLESGELSIEEVILNEISERMRDEVERRKIVIEKNEFLEDIDFEGSLDTLSRQLGRIAAHSGMNLMPIIYANRMIKEVA